jgi:hypothetical protein
MTIHARWRARIALGEQMIMDAFQRFRVIVEMASLAAFIQRQVHVPFGFEIGFGMWIVRDVCMAIRAIQFGSVNGVMKFRGINIHGDFSIRKFHFLGRVIMTAQAEFIFFRNLRRVRSPGGCQPEPQDQRRH